MLIFVLNFWAEMTNVSAGALRSIISGVGLVIGLSWEKSFALAIGAIAIKARQPLWFRDLFDFALVVVVLPAWCLYIIPLAHTELIVEQVASEQGNRPPSVTNSSEPCTQEDTTKLQAR